MDRIVAAVRKNRDHEIRVELADYEGKPIVRIRTGIREDARTTPLKIKSAERGLTFTRDRLDGLIEALKKAREESLS